MKLKKFLTEMSMEEIHVEIKKFLKNNPKPKDDQVHELAEKLGIDPHKFEEHVYMILGDLLKNEDKVGGGKADKATPEKIAKHHGVSVEEINKQIQMGIKVEMEHTDDKNLAKEISMDHLMEFPDYYTKLKKMEKEAGVEHD
jgi:hypothetical protein